MKRAIINSIRKITYGKLGRKCFINKNTLPVYRCKKMDMTYIASSNNIIKFSYQDEVYFFKECRVHNDFFSYINIVIDDYFNNVCCFEKKEKIKNYIKKDLEKRDNFKKLRKINNYVEKHYETIKCEYTGWNIGDVGFKSLFKAYSQGDMAVIQFMNENCAEFVAYIRNEVYAYDLNNYVKKGNYQTYRPSISIATKKLATIFGLDYMVPASWYIRLVCEEFDKIGIVTRECAGICPLELSEKEKLNISPIFQQELNRMNYFDAVCFQRDHKEENYFVEIDNNGKINQVIALDNDSPMTFFPIPKLSFSTSVLCTPVCYGKKPNRPYIDEEFYNILMRIKMRKLYSCVKMEIPFVQRLCMVIRFSTLKKVMVRIQVLNKDEWSVETIHKEISGEYGKTYLKHYIECDENQLIAEIMGVEKDE